MAGVPFDELEGLGTPDTSQAARELIANQKEYARATLKISEFLRSHARELPKEVFLAWKRVVKSGGSPPDTPGEGIFRKCREKAAAVADAEGRFRQSLEDELRTARTRLLRSVRDTLAKYLVFADGEMRARVLKEGASGGLTRRNKHDRAHERHVLLYLQRVCAKNDSMSEFGPVAWGKVKDKQSGIRFSPCPGIARREVFLERWTARSAAVALNADPEIRFELSPRLHPNGRIEGDSFVFMETGQRTFIGPETVNLLRRCDGKTPAYLLGVERTTLEMLADAGMIRWEIEVPALEAHAFDILMDDVSSWCDSPVRARWLRELGPIAALPAEFRRENENSGRVRIMAEASARLSQLGAEKASTRFLYSATNPIGEGCLREGEFSIASELINEVAVDAEPWVDLWRDNYAFVASRVAAGLRGLLEQGAPTRDTMSLPAFLRLCESSKLPLTGPGLVALAHPAFQEVKTAFREHFQDRIDAPEWELSADDCHFVRRNFKYEKFDEYTYPSLDLQLCSRSIEATARGEYQWVVAEMHSPAALLQHGFYWSCPDKDLLNAALVRSIDRKPNFHFGIFAADFTSHTTVRFDATPDFFNFVSGQRPNPTWQYVRPADAEVYVDATSGDVCLRRTDNRIHLGSFARNWIIALGFHPFNFSLGDSTPRLRCGKVIVQRRSWIVRQEELGAGDFTGVSRDLVLAVERLRAAKGWPRYVYIRPTEQVLRRVGAEGRDKDTKPVFIDLESYLFLEIFHRWLTKAGALEMTEMLPAPDHLLWQEPNGRRTFELRTLILPRE